MLRWLATFALLGFLALDLLIPWTPLGRRGAEAAGRHEASGVAETVGTALPEMELLDLDGRPFRLADLHGHRVLLTFERSLDW